MENQDLMGGGARQPLGDSLAQGTYGDVGMRVKEGASTESEATGVERRSLSSLR